MAAAMEANQRAPPLPRSMDNDRVKQMTKYVEENPNVVEVRGLCSETSRSDLALRLFFESKKESGGGEILKLYVSEEHQAAVILFKDCHVAEWLVGKKYISFENCNLTMSWLTINYWNVTECAIFLSDIPNKMFPGQLDRDLLKNHFQSMKYETGKSPTVTNITINCCEKTAFVTFEDFIDVLHLMKKSLEATAPDDTIIAVIPGLPISHMCMKKCQVEAQWLSKERNLIQGQEIRENEGEQHIQNEGNRRSPDVRIKKPERPPLHRGYQLSEGSFANGNQEAHRTGKQAAPPDGSPLEPSEFYKIKMANGTNVLLYMADMAMENIKIDVAVSADVMDNLWWIEDALNKYSAQQHFTTIAIHDSIPGENPVPLETIALCIRRAIISYDEQSRNLERPFTIHIVNFMSDTTNTLGCLLQVFSNSLPNPLETKVKSICDQPEGAYRILPVQRGLERSHNQDDFFSQKRGNDLNTSMSRNSSDKFTHPYQKTVFGDKKGIVRQHRDASIYQPVSAISSTASSLSSVTGSIDPSSISPNPVPAMEAMGEAESIASSTSVESSIYSKDTVYVNPRNELKHTKHIQM